MLELMLGMQSLEQNGSPPFVVEHLEATMHFERRTVHEAVVDEGHEKR